MLIKTAEKTAACREMEQAEKDGRSDVYENQKSKEVFWKQMGVAGIVPQAWKQTNALWKWPEEG